MSRKWLSFDIEITKEVEGHDWLAQRPLGISVACTYLERPEVKERETRYWWGQGRPGGIPWDKMPRQQVCTLVCYLQEMVQEGYTLLTWNGLHFDLNILAEESGMLAECRALARGMVDPMFQFNQMQGYPVGLNAVATAMTGQSKSGTGADAPVKWAAGLYQEVMDYCANDVLILYQLAQEIENRGWIEWVSRSFKLQRLELPQGLLTVQEVLDTIPGHSNPFIPMDSFIGWLEGGGQ